MRRRGQHVARRRRPVADRRASTARTSRAAGGGRGRPGAVVLIAVVVGLGLTATAAYGYFGSGGSGAGSVGTGTMQAVALVADTGTPTSPLYPGGTGDVVLRVHNPNPYRVTLVSVVESGAITADAAHTGCTTTGVTFTAQSGLSQPIGAGATVSVDLPGAASMSASSSSGCQGATFSIPVMITVHEP